MARVSTGSHLMPRFFAKEMFYTFGSSCSYSTFASLILALAFFFIFTIQHEKCAANNMGRDRDVTSLSMHTCNPVKIVQTLLLW